VPVKADGNVKGLISTTLNQQTEGIRHDNSRMDYDVDCPVRGLGRSNLVLPQGALDASGGKSADWFRTVTRHRLVIEVHVML